MRDHSGFRDKEDTPIKVGDNVLYKGHIHKIKKDFRGEFVFESPQGLGDLKSLNSQVLVVTDDK